MRRTGASWVWAVALVCVAGCGPKAYVRAGFLDSPPQTIAVLPFVITYPYDRTEAEGQPELHEIGRDIFRETFYYGLTPRGFDDVHIDRVDATLESQYGPLDKEGWREASTRELGELLGADAVIYGEITRIIYFATPLFTQTSLDADLRMEDTATGEVLWSKKITSVERGGALMQKGQVADFLKDQVRAFRPQEKWLRIADVATRKLMKDFPNPSLALNPAAAAAWWQRGETASTQRLRLAVLPFDVTKDKWLKKAEKLRGYLVADLQRGPFEIVENRRVDAALMAMGWDAGTPPPVDLSLSALADTVHADVFVRGTVTRWGRVYLILHSWVKVGLEVEVVDAQTGELVWFATEQDTRHAGLLKGPTGFKSLVTAPIKGLFPGQLEKVGRHAVRDLAAAMIDAPAVIAYVNGRQPAVAP